MKPFRNDLFIHLFFLMQPLFLDTASRPAYQRRARLKRLAVRLRSVLRYFKSLKVLKQGAMLFLGLPGVLIVFLKLAVSCTGLFAS